MQFESAFVMFLETIMKRPNNFYLHFSLGGFHEPQAKEDGPDPTNEDTGGSPLGPTMEKRVASELTAIAAGGYHGAEAGENAVEDEAAFSGTGGKDDNCVQAALGGS